MKTYIFLDRDGTIIKDEDYYLGQKDNWKDQFKFLPKVLEGMALLSKIPNSVLSVITNQSGIAIKNFPQLTESRVNEINAHLIQELAQEGIIISHCEVCPNVTSEYVKSKRGIYTINDHYVEDNPRRMKPNPGMVLDVLEKDGIESNSARVLVIGDRLSDVQTAWGVNSTSFGVLIPGYKARQKDDEGKLTDLASQDDAFRNRFLIAQDMYSAANYISENLKN